MKDYIKRILSARVYDVAVETPLDPMLRLSKRAENQILLKREDLQPVFSFKIRGAYNKIANLPPELTAKGVICASAGNHAQGVALAARRLGIEATIVMPSTTPDIKVEAVKSFGGNAVLYGNGFDEASVYARQLEKERGLTFIHPYDDPDVIAGQGTIAMEILRQHSGKVDAIFVPIGGGGLAAGIAVYAKYVYPDIKIIGVEPDDAASMTTSIKAHKRVELEQVGLFADGVAVRLVGEETFRICNDLLDDMITVSGDEICAAVKDIFDDTRASAEPSGAVSLAGLKKYAAQKHLSGKTLVAINSGANLNFDRLRYISERAEIGERREALIAVTIPETPGAYRAFIEEMGNRSITEFNYRYASENIAQIFVGIQLRGGDQEKHQIIGSLQDKGYRVVDMTDNEMAKLHVRHMVGGRVTGLKDEMVYRFQFPERPGALLTFLKGLAHGWNISMFHYRNHGAEYGRVLVGIQVPEAERAAFSNFLDELGYPWWDENDNPAYHLFLDGQY
ncbi:threonine ammonia-lyase, biosynthetic [Microvirga sp. W0021]|uniref:L-threonine dehydratase n=1 Tax=Hohaiivirga grylli TaxID=3133970 RepID=A0ABV0BFA1_9HYPH